MSAGIILIRYAGLPLMRTEAERRAAHVGEAELGGQRPGWGPHRAGGRHPAAPRGGPRPLHGPAASPRGTCDLMDRAAHRQPRRPGPRGQGEWLKGDPMTIEFIRFSIRGAGPRLAGLDGWWPSRKGRCQRPPAAPAWLSAPTCSHEEHCGYCGRCWARSCASEKAATSTPSRRRWSNSEAATAGAAAILVRMPSWSCTNTAPSAPPGGTRASPPGTARLGAAPSEPPKTSVASHALTGVRMRSLCSVPRVERPQRSRGR